MRSTTDTATIVMSADSSFHERSVEIGWKGEHMRTDNTCMTMFDPGQYKHYASNPNEHQRKLVNFKKFTANQARTATCLDSRRVASQYESNWKYPAYGMLCACVVVFPIARHFTCSRQIQHGTKSQAGFLLILTRLFPWVIAHNVSIQKTRTFFVNVAFNKKRNGARPVRGLQHRQVRMAFVRHAYLCVVVNVIRKHVRT